MATGRPFTNILIFFDEKTRGKGKEHREYTGDFVLLGAWQPCSREV